jgi:hypothetical protein
MLELMPQRSGGYWTRERTIALDLITFHCVISIVSFAAAWKRPIAWVCLAVAAISACALVYFPDYLDRLYHVIQ